MEPINIAYWDNENYSSQAHSRSISDTSSIDSISGSERSISTPWSIGSDTSWDITNADFTTWDFHTSERRKSNGQRHQAIAADASALLARIQAKADELTTGNIDDHDIPKLKARCAFRFESDACTSLTTTTTNKQVTPVTAWRAASARRMYSTVQQWNPHLLLPVLLAVPPTKCATPAFKAILPMLQQDTRFLSYRLLPSEKLVQVLQSFAADISLSSNSDYTKFLTSILPQVSNDTPPSNAREDTTTNGDQSYSSVSIDQLPLLLQSLLPGVFGSEIAINEALDGSVTSERVSIMVPLNAKDCVCKFVISREAAVDAIRNFNLRRVAEGGCR